MRIADERQREAGAHHPGADIFTLDKAFPKESAVFVGPYKIAIPRSAGGIFDQLVARGDAAGPTAAIAIKADLIGFRRIDAGKADLDLSDLNGVTVNNAGLAGNVTRKRSSRERERGHNGACAF